MSEHPEGSYKFDPASKSIAVRTRYPETGPLIAHAWQIATIGDGGATRSSAEVETWIDIPQDVIDGLAQAHGEEPTDG